MSQKINLTPQDLQFIINQVDKMKNTIIETANSLQSDTIKIKSKWDDNQFASFQSQIILYNKQLKQVADQLEKEKQRVIEYQQRTQAAADRFGR